VTDPLSRTVGFLYDAAGRLSTLTISRGTSTYACDPVKGNPSSIPAP
jgi:YD repeat-containing protein